MSCNDDIGTEFLHHFKKIAEIESVDQKPRLYKPF
jgi:hypothetical protein